VEVAGPLAAPFGPDARDADNRWAAQLFENHFYARVATIYGGSNEIQRNIIARSLGLGGVS
jgi:alkylation response protein AidB-like acyl-CoA dehydrogenase